MYAITRSDLFDRTWYLNKYPDVAESGADPLRHYIAYGARELRDPGPYFSARVYLQRYPDVAVTGINPLGHYLRYGMKEGREIPPAASNYEKWIKRYDTLGPAQREFVRLDIARWTHTPIISVIMPVYNTAPRWLNAAISSVERQIYPHWELCISDDASLLTGVHEALRAAARSDSRIKLNIRNSRGHICANTNSALALASGEYIALMDSDDEIAEDALYWVARELQAHPLADLIFSDEDKIDKDGRRFEPYFKSDWNPALMLSQNAFCHLGVYRRSLVLAIGGFREGYEGSQDHDLALRAADASSPERIRHIPRVLYHWRALPNSTALTPAIKSYAWDAGRRSIEDHLARQQVRARVGLRSRCWYQVDYEAADRWPCVTIICPSTLTSEVSYKCIMSILTKTNYENFSLIVMLNNDKVSTNLPNALDAERKFNDRRARVMTYDRQPFNYSWVNNLGVANTDSEYICFLNDDIQVISTDWLGAMVVRCMQKRVGAVGAMLYYPNNRIQHAGAILGVGGVADHAFRNLRRGSEGYFGRALLEQDVSCVTAACMIVRREAFDQVGWFDERLPCAFNDVDLCLRLRQAGWRIIWTPKAELYHQESMTMGHHASGERAAQFQQDVRLMRGRWHSELDVDPFYNPNLALDPAHQFELAFPPRIVARSLLDQIK